MAADRNSVVYAHVVLRPPGGKPLVEDAQITAATLASFAPSPKDVNAVRIFFTNAGFDTTDLAGISFSISGSVRLFEEFFQVKVRSNDHGAISVRTGGIATDDDKRELPSNVLSESIAPLVEAIVFSPPVDFGPDAPFS